METLKLTGFLLLVLLQLAKAGELQELLEGSGSEVEETTPSFTDDYVNCPPDDPVLRDVEDIKDDYVYDYDEPISIPAVPIDDLVNSGENGTEIELIQASSKSETIDESDKIEIVTEAEEFDDDEASGEQEFSSSLKLIKTPKIYSLPETESLDARVKAFIEEHPEETELISENYPAPYPNEVNSYKDYTVTGGIGVQVTIHNIDLDHETDFLYIRGGSVNDKDEKGPVLTGTITDPIRFLIPHTTTFTVHFVSQHSGSVHNTHQGFRLTYAPFGTVVSPTTPTTTEMIVPREELQWIRKEISMTQMMMASVETWPLVKMTLSNATNAFIEQNQLKYKPCRPEDIRILAQKCPDTWPNYEECLTLEFAVPLRPIITLVEDESDGLGLDQKGKLAAKGFIPLTTTETPEAEYQLSQANLDWMWNDFGAMELASVGIDVYTMPENSSVLLIWIAISLCVVAAFMMVLYSIWKIDIFKDYRRISKLSRDAQEEDRNELKKKEFDISMFPSPHQIVPSLFPTGDPYGDRNTEAQYAYDNSTMNPFAEDMNEPRFEAFGDSPAPNRQQKQQPQVFEPLSPMDYSPSIVDFNETPEQRSPRRSRNNPFLSGNGGGFNQSGSRP